VCVRVTETLCVQHICFIINILCGPVIVTSAYDWVGKLGAHSQLLVYTYGNIGVNVVYWGS
jgi:hypothetical protein